MPLFNVKIKYLDEGKPEGGVKEGEVMLDCDFLAPTPGDAELFANDLMELYAGKHYLVTQVNKPYEHVVVRK